MVKLGLVKRECVATSIHITVRCTPDEIFKLFDFWGIIPIGDEQINATGKMGDNPQKDVSVPDKKVEKVYKIFKSDPALSKSESTSSEKTKAEQE